MIRVLSAALLAAVAVAQTATAQSTQANCPADAKPLPAPLAGWSAKTPLTAAVDTAGLAAAMLDAGKAVDLALRPTPNMRYALRPERPGGSVSHGGMVAFTVPAAGTYRVALGSAAWIDLVADGKALQSVAHGHGPACSGIRKMVDFALAPGNYTLQIAGNGSPEVAVMIARLP